MKPTKSMLCFVWFLWKKHGYSREPTSLAEWREKKNSNTDNKIPELKIKWSLFSCMLSMACTWAFSLLPNLLTLFTLVSETTPFSSTPLHPLNSPIKKQSLPSCFPVPGSNHSIHSPLKKRLLHFRYPLCFWSLSCFFVHRERKLRGILER